MYVRCARSGLNAVSRARIKRSILNGDGRVGPRTQSAVATRRCSKRSFTASNSPAVPEHLTGGGRAGRRLSLAIKGSKLPLKLARGDWGAAGGGIGPVWEVSKELGNEIEGMTYLREPGGWRYGEVWAVLIGPGKQRGKEAADCESRVDRHSSLRAFKTMFNEKIIGDKIIGISAALAHALRRQIRRRTT